MASSSSSSSSSNSPCAACKFLRRKCMPGCIFAPYFPPEEPQKFANVHKIFGASNVTKLLNELLPHQREDAVNSLAYEAEARMKDPVYGCVGAISVLQRQVHRLQKELDAANADLIRYACNEIPAPLQPPQPPPHHHHHHHHHHQGLPHLAPLRQRSFEFGRRGSNISTSTTSSAAHGGSSSFYGGATTPALQLPNYPSTAPWSSNTGVDPTGDNMHTRGGGSAGGENSNM